MVLMEFSITPMGQGESVSKYVARCLEIVDRSGLDYRLHAMGTVVEGELHAVLELLEQCTQAVTKDCPRVSVSAKLDVRQGATGRLAGKVASVEKQLGRTLKK
jgi:uncharacterized protein (TIGR00106 family)